MRGSSKASCHTVVPDTHRVPAECVFRRRKAFLRIEAIIQQSSGAENGGRSWICTTIEHGFLFTVELLVFFWRSWKHQVKMLDKKWLLGVQLKLERWRDTTTGPLRTLASADWSSWKDVRRRWDGGNRGAFFKLVVPDSGQNRRWKRRCKKLYGLF